MSGFKKGFGLIEVIIVVSIFLIVITGIISIIGLGSKNIMKNEARWKASLLAQNFLEQRAVIRDNVILDWLTTNPGPTTKLADTAWKTYNGYNVQKSGCPTSSMTPANVYYDDDMSPLPSSSGSFFTLSYYCPDYGAGNVIHVVTVSWNEFGQSRSISNTQFLKNVSGAVH